MVNDMSQLTFAVLLQFGIAVAANIGSLGLLPLTGGFTRPAATAACVTLFILNIWMLSRLIHGGAPLSLLTPVMAALIPLVTIAMGVLFYGENSSPLRIGLLIGACALSACAAAVRG